MNGTSGIFSEIYSAYYNAVASIINELQKGEKNEKKLSAKVTEHAFGESFMTILPSLKCGKWQIVKPDMTTTLQHPPTMPLTLLQKRWLKAVSLDPRMRLFGITFKDLDDVQPLFMPDDYCIYDKYSDGDNFDDPGYIERFRIILHAVREKLPLEIDMTARNGNRIVTKCMPLTLEYSEKDDKFRLITSGNRFVTTVNLAKVNACRIIPSVGKAENHTKKNTSTVTLEITDDRSALERCMLHFAHFEKRAEKISDNKYRLYINYDTDDTSEIVIRVLSFGPMVEVTAPESFRDLIVKKLERQLSCGIKSGVSSENIEKTE